MLYLALVACAGIPLAAQVAPPVPGLDEPMRGAVHVIDPATRPPCQVWTSLEQVARHAQVRMGFEHTLDCHLAAWTRQPYARPALRLDGLTPRQAFDRLLAHRADYQWRMIDGVAVFRPRAAWVTGSVLNRPVAPTSARDQHPHDLLHTVLQLTRPSLFQDHIDVQRSSYWRRNDDPSAVAPIDTPVSVAFAGGSLIDALNAITRPFSGHWETGYQTGSGQHRVHIRLLMLDYDGGMVSAISGPFDAAAPWSP
ncbi:MAG: hypothetical protein AB7H93_21755 [Vicinamibacterales bacterium]